MKSNRKALKKRIAELEDVVRRRKQDLALRNRSDQERTVNHNLDEPEPILDNARREEIERDFVNWRSPASIAKEYGVKNQLSIGMRMSPGSLPSVSAMSVPRSKESLNELTKSR